MSVHPDTSWNGLQVAFQAPHAPHSAPAAASFAPVVSDPPAQAEIDQRRKLETIGLMAGGLVHDISNLLQAIAARVELMQMRGVRQGDLETILDVIATAGVAIDDLRAFMRHAPPQADIISLSVLEPRILGQLRFLLPGTISIKLDFSAATWPVHVNTNRLQLAILNLAVNAKDAMPNGGTLRLLAGNRTLSDATSNAKRDCVAIVVSDNGIGMANEVAARACEPFFTTKGPDVGTGLGLSQVHDFVRQCGGDLMLDSAPGVGTTATLLLPRAPAAICHAAPPIKLPDGREMTTTGNDGGPVNTGLAVTSVLPGQRPAWMAQPADIDSAAE